LVCQPETGPAGLGSERRPPHFGYLVYLPFLIIVSVNNFCLDLRWWSLSRNLFRSTKVSASNLACSTIFNSDFLALGLFGDFVAWTLPAWCWGQRPQSGTYFKDIRNNI
jgi:hypothetical protein